MRFNSKTLLACLILSGFGSTAAFSETVIQNLSRKASGDAPVVIDPEFAGVGPDKETSAGSFYGVALYDFDRPVASFTPTGRTDGELQDSRDAVDQKLRKMLLQAQKDNQDPSNSKKSYLLYLNDSLRIIEVSKADPKGLQKAVKLAFEESQRAQYESSDEHREKTLARQNLYDETPLVHSPPFVSAPEHGIKKEKGRLLFQEGGPVSLF